MQKYCEKCGNKLCDGGDVCLKCGCVIKKNNKISNGEHVFFIFKSMFIPLFVVLVPYIIFIILLIGTWFVQDIENDIRCRNAFGSEYKIERGPNIDNGVCCIKGEPGNNCKSLRSLDDSYE